MNLFDLLLGGFVGALLVVVVLAVHSTSKQQVIDSCKEYNMYATNGVVMRCEVMELKK